MGDFFDNLKKEAEKAVDNVVKEVEVGIEVVGNAGHDAIQTVGDAGHDVIADAGNTVGNVAAQAAQVALAPHQLALVAFDVIQGNPNAAKERAQNLVEATADVASATAHIASEPYFFAGKLTRDLGGDVGMIVRGANNAALIQTNIVPAILQKVAHADAQTAEEIAQAVSQAPLSVLLAAALEAAHDQFRPIGREVPTQVKRLLRGFYPDEIIDNARWVVASFGLTLPEAINGFQGFMGNHAFAVTVGDVIVFSVEPTLSESAVAWWAHEMQHVVQYDRWGFDGFADKYVSNGPEIETEAETKSAEVMAD